MRKPNDKIVIKLKVYNCSKVMSTKQIIKITDLNKLKRSLHVRFPTGLQVYVTMATYIHIGGE